MQEDKICPYPGLRPFNDDESIFFKGRDKNIATIIELFEKKKFMMLTGASGDGKSSLVYAGIVPNARAGLFKAKYNNWAVADFRPERTPLENLSKSLNKFFGFESDNLLTQKLSYGFSSLSNIYKNSPLYINTEGKEWKEADDAKKKQIKRKAANLLIIADQFEEFFTNTENYHNGIASVESQTVVHLLLETAQLALTEDLPIYIVCTMRSDYIGQCAAFRGLPEYIGFSQFFVPRLKRNEISQVIEEPAMLNGDKISRRLAERLLNDITEGYDQLPILQHALNQIWKIAKRGSEEMDLIHYAMVGGIAPNQLPADDQVKFKNWFEQLLDFKKRLFANPSLENILNAHADELLETSYDRNKSRHPAESGISKDDAQLIIKSTFQCLTKIDEARAVRNRMTLQEIADIIQKPNINADITGKILDIFREQGNTFIKPFITENPETHKTKKETVLDITHESLIRNWNILDKWAKEEYDNLLTWQDFYKQLQRWVKSGKTKGYLLPIGPLTFFESWYNSCKPNKYWLARYDEREVSFEEKTKNAEEILNNANEFIRRSALALFVSRTVMKYGANRIISIIGILILTIACTYFYFDYRGKQNEYVIKDITEKGIALLHSNKVKNKVKANFLINQERLYPGSAEQILNSLHNDTLAYDIAFETFGLSQNYDAPDKLPNHPLVHRLIIYIDSSLSQILLSSKNPEKESLSKNIDRINNYLKLYAFINYYKSADDLNTRAKKYLLLLESYVNYSLSDPKNAKTESFNTSIELMLALSDFKREFSDTLLKKLSPFSDLGRITFDALYPRGEKIKVDWGNYYSHKGGYQVLTYLYTVSGDYKSMSRCLDSIIANNKEYKKFGRESIYDIFYCMTKYSNVPSDQSEEFLKKFFTYSSYAKNKFYEDIASAVTTRKLTFRNIKSDDWFELQNNLLKFFLPEQKVEKLWGHYSDVIEKKYTNADERNFNLALCYKQKGIYYTYQFQDDQQAGLCFDKAFELFIKTSKVFLEKDYTFYNITGEKNAQGDKIRNSVAFLYPNMVNRWGWEVFNLWQNEDRNTYPLFDYISNHKMHYMYAGENVKAIENFLYSYYDQYKYDFLGRKTGLFNKEYIGNVLDIFKQYVGSDNNLKNFIKLIAINNDFEKDDTANAFAVYREFDGDAILKEEFQKQERPRDAVHKGLLRDLAKNLALHGRLSESFKCLKALKDPWDRRNTLINICYSLQEKGPVENTFIYLDSLFTEVEKKPKFGMKLFSVTGMIGSGPLFEVSMNLFKDVDDKVKPRGMNNFIKGISREGLYYKAFEYIPEYASRVNELELYNEILHAEIINKQKKKINMQNLPWRRHEEQVYGENIPENYEWEREHFDMFAE